PPRASFIRSSDLDAFIRRGCQVAEPTCGGGAGGRLVHSTSDVLARAHIQMKLDLVSDVVLGARSPEAEIAAPRRKRAFHPAVSGLGGASSAAKTACAKRVNVAASSRS